MKLNKILTTLLLSTLPLYSLAQAPKKVLDVYTIEGSITPETFTDFRETFDEYDIKVVKLMSGGGDLYAAINIGFLLSQGDTITFIPKNTGCASACGYIFLSGKYKVLRGGLGMHEFSQDGVGYTSLSDKIKLDNTETMLTVSNYLGTIGVSYKFLLDSLNTPSEDMTWVEDINVLNKYILKGYLISN